MIEDATQDMDCWRVSTSTVHQRSDFSTKSSYEIGPKYPEASKPEQSKYGRFSISHGFRY